MKQGKISAQPSQHLKRLLFFDVMRIFFVAAIVYVHLRVGGWVAFNNFFYPEGYLPFNIYPIGLQGWAVYGLIFISGAVLQYNYKQVEGYAEYVKFLLNRFIRIYPAFWISLLFGLLLNIILSAAIAGDVLKGNLFFILFEYTGFFAVLGRGPGFINEMGWFIATIISLYLLFPYLSKTVKKYQFNAIIALLIITLVSRSFFLTHQNGPTDLLWRWFPLCNLFEFCLGIYIIQISFYPKNTHDHPFIHDLADLSFYVFLFHVIIIQAFTKSIGFALQYASFLDTIFIEQRLLGYSIWYISIQLTTLLVSVIAWAIDKRVQKQIRQNERVKQLFKI